MKAMLASGLSWELAAEGLLQVAGKDCEGEAAASALAALRTALADRLLQLLGKLDDVLNSSEQIKRFCALQLPVVEAVLASDALAVDCEESVFCAVALWMDASSLAHEEQLAAAACLLPRIRFANMRPANIANYWHAYQWFREWDPDKQVLVEALVHAADPQLALVSAKVGGAKLAARFAWRHSYEKPTRLEFVSEIDVSAVEGSGTVILHGPSQYWAGAWWHVSCEVGFGGGQDNVGLYLRTSLPPGATFPEQGLVGCAAAVGVVLDFVLSARHQNGISVAWDSAHKASSVTLCPLRSPDAVRTKGTGRGWPSFVFKGTIDGAPITRANFKAAGSPVVRDGKMALHATVAFSS
ncbi:hypothetical protein ABPG75_012583 [Micractinium tetrahymenae]